MHNLKYLVLLLVLGVFLASCEKDDSSVIDPVLYYPSVLNGFMTPNAFDTAYLSGVISAGVSSQLPIKSVKANIFNPANVLVTTVELKDDGVLPDTIAGDGRYTGSLGTQLDCKFVGAYKVEIVAQNSSGLNSGPYILNFTLSNNNNQKPYIGGYFVPDSIQRPSGADTAAIFLQVKGLDPDGPCDVNSAFFNSFKPNGVPSTGNPFPMYDDGDILAHGDSVASDKKYSLIVIITSQALLGDYTFKFNIRDQSNLLSDTLSRIIRIY